MEQVSYLPKANRMIDIKFKIEDAIAKSDQIKWFVPQRYDYVHQPRQQQAEIDDPTPSQTSKKDEAENALYIRRLIMNQLIEPLNSELICNIAEEYQRLFGYADTGSGGDSDSPSKPNNDGEKLLKLMEKFYRKKLDDKQLQKLLRQV